MVIVFIFCLRCKYLRRLDRNLHSGVYPHLYHPEVYLLHGGYKHFFLCFPVCRNE